MNDKSITDRNIDNIYENHLCTKKILRLLHSFRESIP